MSIYDERMQSMAAKAGEFYLQEANVKTFTEEEARQKVGRKVKPIREDMFVYIDEAIQETT